MANADKDNESETTDIRKLYRLFCVFCIRKIHIYDIVLTSRESRTAAQSVAEQVTIHHHANSNICWTHCANAPTVAL